MTEGRGGEEDMAMPSHAKNVGHENDSEPLLAPRRLKNGQRPAGIKTSGG